MADDQKQQQNTDANVDERPLDPSGNYGDMIGDTQGQTGVTVGSAQQSSAEPSDTVQDVDTANLPGGIESPSGPRTQPTGIPKTAQNDNAYQQSVRQGMSTVAGAQSDDTASVSDTNNQNQSQISYDDGRNQNTVISNQPKQVPVNDDQMSRTQTTDPDSGVSPSLLGSYSVSGTEPDPDSDDDTLQNAHDVGFQPDEDLEHPKEVDAGRDIDRAEEEIKNS